LLRSRWTLGVVRGGNSRTLSPVERPPRAPSPSGGRSRRHRSDGQRARQLATPVRSARLFALFAERSCRAHRPACPTDAPGREPGKGSPFATRSAEASWPGGPLTSLLPGVTGGQTTHESRVRTHAKAREPVQSLHFPGRSHCRLFLGATLGTDDLHDLAALHGERPVRLPLVRAVAPFASQIPVAHDASVSPRVGLPPWLHRVRFWPPSTGRPRDGSHRALVLSNRPSRQVRAH